MPLVLRSCTLEDEAADGSSVDAAAAWVHLACALWHTRAAGAARGVTVTVDDVAYLTGITVRRSAGSVAVTAASCDECGSGAGELLPMAAAAFAAAPRDAAPPPPHANVHVSCAVAGRLAADLLAPAASAAGAADRASAASLRRPSSKITTA